MNRPSTKAEPYAELNHYLQQLQPAIRTTEAKRVRLIVFGIFNDTIKRINYVLKCLSIAIILLFIFSFFLLITGQDDVIIDYAGVLGLLFLVAIMVKIFLPLVDLEIRRAQYVVILCLTLLFILGDPSQWIVHVTVASSFILLVTASRMVKRAMKLATLDWLTAEGIDVHNEWADVDHPLRQRHRALGIDSFSHAGYRRVFQLTRRKKTTGIKAISANGNLGKDQVAVEVWQRNPWTDLSAIREFFVCCFLGGAQDASIFEFIRTPALTMLDMVSLKGRTIRVLLMACTSRINQSEQAVLVVNAVFGREGGLIGSLRQDNAFIRDQIEAYARSTGFTHVLYNLTPTNNRPRQFVSYLGEQLPVDPQRLGCRLTWSDRPLKLEIFNRHGAGLSIYWTLLMEMFSFKSDYALSGAIRGHLVELRHPEGDWLRRLEATGENQIRADFGWLKIEAPADLVDALQQAWIGHLIDWLPAFDPPHIARTVRLRWATLDHSLWQGRWEQGCVEISTSFKHIESQDLRAELISLALAEHLLWRWHPGPELAWRCEVLEATGLRERVAANLAGVAQARDALGPWQLLNQIIHESVLSTYSVKMIIKTKRLYAALEEFPDELESGVLAQNLFEKSIDERPGLGEQLFGGLGAQAVELITEVLIEEMNSQIRYLRTPWLMSDDFAWSALSEITESLFDWQKWLKKMSVEISDNDLHRQNYLLQRARLASMLGEAGNLLKLGKRQQLEKQLAILHKERAELKNHGFARMLVDLERHIRFAPVQKWIDKFNMDQHL